MPHIHTRDGEFDYTVSAIIIHDDKVLLLLHHKLQMWLPPAGHIELNETPLEALFRETEEESGLTPDNLTLVTPYSDNLRFARDEDKSITQPMPFDIDIHAFGSTNHRHIDFAYILSSDTDIVTPEADGAQELRWFTLEELASLDQTPKSTYSRTNYAMQQIKEINS